MLSRDQLPGRLAAIRPGGRLIAGAVAALGLVAAVAIALFAPPPREPLMEAGGRGAAEKERRSFLALMIPPPPEAARGTGAPTSVQELAERMPLQRKAAQLFLVGFEGDDASASIVPALRRTDWGGILIGRDNYRSPGRLAKLVDAATAAARKADHVAPFVMTSQEGGRDSSLADLPPAEAQPRVKTPSRARRAALETGKALAALGINGVLGPLLDVGGVGSPIAKRAYSDDPAEVAALGRAAVTGYGRAGLVAAPKHFPGIGAARESPEEGPTSVGLSPAELESRDLIPFAAALEAGAPAVVIGHAAYSSDDYVTPASGSRAIIGGLLRERLGFEGLAITDDLALPAAIVSQGSIPDAAVASLRAGADMLLLSGPRGEQEAAYLAVLNAVRRGEISRTRLDQAVLRVLTAKERAGLIR